MSLTMAKRLREERAEIVTKVQSLIATAQKEERDLTDTESQQIEKMQAESLAKRRQYEAIEKAEEESKEMDSFRDAHARAEHERRNREGDDAVTYEDVDLATRAWMLAAVNDGLVTDEMRAAAQKCHTRLGTKSLDNELRFRKRALTRQEAQKLAMDLHFRATGPQTLTTTKGGYTFTSTIVDRMEIQMALHGGMRQVANVIRTQSGEQMLFPTVDDTAQKATILNLNTAAAGNDITFGQKAISVFKYTSGLVLVPMELLQDTAVDLIGFIGDALGRRVAFGTNEHFTVGSTGGSNPVGIVTRAPATVSTTSTSGNIPTWLKLKDLEHSVDPLYRNNASWMMHDTWLSEFEKEVDLNGRPILSPATSSPGSVDRIFGYPVVVNQQCYSNPTTTNRKVVLFGDFAKYVIRDVQGIDTLRLDERYAEKAQTAWLTFSRHGGDAVFASTANAPVQAIIQTTT